MKNVIKTFTSDNIFSALVYKLAIRHLFKLQSSVENN